MIYCPFDNFLPSFSELRNFSFIEGPIFFFGEKLTNKMLIYNFIWIKHTTQGVLKRTKQVEVWWYKVRPMWWVWQHIPSKLQWFFTGDQTCVWSRVAVMEHNSFMINELWILLDSFKMSNCQQHTFESIVCSLVGARKTWHLKIPH